MKAWGVMACGLALLLSAASAAQGQEDRSITIAIQDEPIDLDPCTVGHPFNGLVTGQNVFETLTTLDPVSGEGAPHLALSWETVSPGTWRFELRPDVKFHDGTAFDATAVKTALERLGGRDFTCAGLINKIQQFDVEVVVVDAGTIEMSTTNMPLPLPHYLSGVGMGAASTSAGALERDPVGTGPYQFDRWRTGEGITLSRFVDYWGDQPEVERVDYVFRQEANLRAIMVEAGEADIAVHVAPQDATNDEVDFPYVNKETTRIRMIMQPPLDDIRVRQALNLAFDREALIGTVLSASVIPATQFITPDVNGYNPDLSLWEYDLDEARRLIEAARADGAPVEQRIRLVAHPTIYPNVSEALQVLAQMWQEAGLTVQVELMERAQWRMLVNKPYAEERPAMLIQEQHDNTDGDAVATMRNRYHTEGGLSEFSNPEVDRLIELAEASEGDVRRESFEEANRIIAEDIIPAVPMYHMVSYMRVGERLEFVPAGFYSAALLPVSGIKFADQ